MGLCPSYSQRKCFFKVGLDGSRTVIDKNIPRRNAALIFKVVQGRRKLHNKTVKQLHDVVCRSCGSNLTLKLEVPHGRRTPSIKWDFAISGSIVLYEHKSTQLDRNNDKVYKCTTDVVKAVMALSHGVQQSLADQYLDLVKKVGLELRSLLTTVDEIVSYLPLSAIREVEMAHKVLSKDMGELVSAMKLAQQYSRTTVDAEYRKGMLSAAHVLAMDSKNLLDVIDSIRIRHPQINQLVCKADGSESNQQPNSQEDEKSVDVPTRKPLSPTDVSCSFVSVPVYSNNIETIASSNLPLQTFDN